MSDIVLAIDTSINYCSVAIYKKKYLFSLSKKSEKEHTKKILPMIQKILFQTKIKFKELNYVAFSRGPGNFTALRIASSIAYSLSISLKIPIISVSTLAIMAEKAWRKYQKRKVIVALNAQKTKIYWAKYIRNKKSVWMGEDTESLLDKDILKNKIENLNETWTLIGNGWEENEYKKSLNLKKTDIFFPEAQDIIPLVLLKIKNKQLLYSEEKKINYLYNQF